MQIQNNDTHVIENCIKACKASYALFLKHNRISTDEENEASKRGHLIGDNSNRKMEYTRKAAMSTHYKKLVKFIRLNDLIISRASLNLAIDLMKKVKEALIVTEEKKAISKNRKRRTRRIILYPLFVIDLK